MSDEITIKPANGTWVVRAGGAVLGESENALEVSIDGESTIYFPQDDIATVFLDESETTETTGLGALSFFSIVTKSTTLKDSAWSVSVPSDEAAQIGNHLAFQTSELVAVEKL